MAPSAKLAATAAQQREEFATERSWIVDLLGSLRETFTQTGEDGTSSPRRGMVLAGVTAATLFITGATGMFLVHRSAAQLEAAAQANSAQAASSVLPAANATESAQAENNSSSTESAVPITTKTENFPGSQARGFADIVRAYQPSAKKPSVEQKILNGKSLAAPVVVHRSVIGREAPPDLNAVTTNTGTATIQGIFAPFMPAGGRMREPKLLRSFAPNYPSMAKNAKVEGEVKVDAVIDINGKLTGMKVVSGSPLLQQAALSLS